MTDDGPHDAWRLDEQRPHEEAHGRAQVEGVLARLGAEPARVIDLGCGAGRVLVPLAVAGHRVTGVDRDPGALSACRERLPAGAPVQLVEGDFRDAAPFAGGPFDAAVCLGNTFMTIADIDEAVAHLRRAREALAPDGWLAIDDAPADLWPELTDGNWQSGVTATGEAQLVWHASDAVFALRQGADVDVESPHLQPADVRYRMWTDGALALAARAAGLSAPERDEAAHLLLFRRTAAS